MLILIKEHSKNLKLMLESKLLMLESKLLMLESKLLVTILNFII